MAPDSGMAFLVIQHLSPGRKSQMAQVLQQFTRLPVSEAEQGMPAGANHVYVIPPGRLLSIAEGTLRLLDDPPTHRQRMPIDYFFRALAEDQGSNAIGIVLSGAGSDGALGLEAFKAHDGFTLAETPPHMVVDDNGTIVYFSRDTGRMLEPAQGIARHNLLDMARPGLRHALRSALHNARQTGGPSRQQNIPVTGERGHITVDLTVRPMPPQPNGDSAQYLVIFRPHGSQEPWKNETSAATPEEAEDEQGTLVRQLEQELAATKEDLQTTVEELETSNEELQSANEELLSSNEELETSKEELQSVNEEMETVNQELTNKVEELRESQSDIETLLHRSGVGMVFLDRGLRIRRFTTHAQEVLALISTELERPVTDISAKFEANDLAGNIRKVLREETTFQEIVNGSHNGKTYMMRILPYERKIDGCGKCEAVLVFVDITGFLQK